MFTYAYGDKYEGDWQDDKKHGEGKMLFADGTTYVGDFNEDKM